MQNIGIVGKPTLPLRAAVALLLLFALHMMPNAALAQAAKMAVPVAQTVASPANANAAEIDELREQTKSAVFDKTVAEAKLEVIAAGNSRMEVLIGAFGILVTLLFAGFGYVTFRQTTKAASAFEAQISAIKNNMENMEKSASVTSKKIEQHAEQVLSAENLALVAMPASTTRLETSIPAAQQLELNQAAKAASEIPRDQRSAQDFRVLMFQAQRDKKWQDYVDLAEGMAYLHGADPDDLAFALFGKAIGQNELKNYELASIYWADYFGRCPGDDAESGAGALNNWGNALSDQAKTKQGDTADALYSAAGEKYAAALAVKPDDHYVLNNWGTALLDQAKKTRGKKRAALLGQAEEKLLQAEQLMPGSGSYNLACVYGRRGDAAQAAEWLKKAKDIGVRCPDCAHIAADLDFKTVCEAPEFVQALKDIGC